MVACLASNILQKSAKLDSKTMNPIGEKKRLERLREQHAKNSENVFILKSSFRALYVRLPLVLWFVCRTKTEHKLGSRHGLYIQ